MNDANPQPAEDGPLDGRRPAFKRGDLVRKRSGSQWQGHVVGEYSTALTPEGYAVESDVHVGSVQIYPAAALERVPEKAWAPTD
jgi:hypothetical protein